MKEKLKAFSESTVAKILLATIVPGGFIAWGAYEIGKAIGVREVIDSDKSTGDSSKTEDTV